MDTYESTSDGRGGERGGGSEHVRTEGKATPGWAFEAGRPPAEPDTDEARAAMLRRAGGTAAFACGEESAFAEHRAVGIEDGLGGLPDRSGDLAKIEPAGAARKGAASSIRPDGAQAHGERAHACALRNPKSTSVRPGAVTTQHAALEAMTLSRCGRFIRRISTSCASGSGTVTRRTGSSAKKIVHSNIALAPPGKRKPVRLSTKRGEKWPLSRSQASASSSKRKVSRKK